MNERESLWVRVGNERAQENEDLSKGHWLLVWWRQITNICQGREHMNWLWENVRKSKGGGSKT